jgi:hypothetical protein
MVLHINHHLMSKKKHKKKANTPRCKRMSRNGRIQSAQTWIRQYPGKNIVKGYAKHFGVSKLCAALELRMVGIAVDESTFTQLRAAEQAIAIQRQLARQTRQAREEKDEEVWEEFEETPLICNGSDAHVCWECEIRRPSGSSEHIDADDLPF